MDPKEAFKTLERDRAVSICELADRLLLGDEEHTNTTEVYGNAGDQVWFKSSTIYFRPSDERGLRPELREMVRRADAVPFWLKAKKLKIVPVYWFNSEDDFLSHFLGKSDAPREDRRKSLEKLLFKSTECGAWIQFKDDCVRVGSIVEGCDFGTSIYPLKYPFSDVSYFARIAAVEHDADETFKWANDADDNDQTAADRGEDAPDVSFDYEHLGQDGCSS